MQISLNYWKALLLLTPFIIGSVLTNLVLTPGGLTHPWGIIATYLLVIGFLIITACQAYILVSFINVTKKDLYFKINALIPVAFLIAYLIYMVYLNFKLYHPVNSSAEPVKVSNLNLVGLIISLLMIHAAINFFLTNNNYVSWQIKKIADQEKQAELKNNYLKPMRILVRTTAYMLLIFVVVTMFLDVSQILTPRH